MDGPRILISQHAAHSAGGHLVHAGRMFVKELVLMDTYMDAEKIERCQGADLQGELCAHRGTRKGT